MSNSKPLVIAATACEKVLQEKKDDVVSIIRMVDTFQMSTDVPIVHVNAIVALKSGDVTGNYEIKLRIRTPSGDLRPIDGKWPVYLKGGEHGVTIGLTINLESPVIGLYWIDVVWQDDVLTSFPIKLVRSVGESRA